MCDGPSGDTWGGGVVVHLRLGPWMCAGRGHISYPTSPREGVLSCPIRSWATIFFDKFRCSFLYKKTFSQALLDQNPANPVQNPVPNPVPDNLRRIMQNGHLLETLTSLDIQSFQEIELADGMVNRDQHDTTGKY